MTGRYRAPSPFEPVAGYSEPQKRDRLARPRPLASEWIGAAQAISIGCIRFIIMPVDLWQRRRDSNPRGRGFGDRRSRR